LQKEDIDLFGTCGVDAVFIKPVAVDELVPRLIADVFARHSRRTITPNS